jgi:hypothetical protein
MAKVKRNINYLGKDFGDFRDQLVNFSKTYFPTTYTDFSSASPGMMFMEQASYVGDVLSFYLDNQIQETFLQYARQTDNLFNLAYMFGYKPKTTGLSTVDVDFFQLLPAKVNGGSTVPDYDYAVQILENTQLSSIARTPYNFIVEDLVDFKVSSSLDPTEITVAQVSANLPTYYLLKKKRKAISGEIKSITFSFGEYEEFPTVELSGKNVAYILDATDSDGNKWYEVDYLGEESVYDNIKNTNVNDPNNVSDNSDTPYILQLKKVQRRFATRFLDDTTLQIQFGNGNSNDTDETIVPNTNNVGLGLPFEVSKLKTAYSPTNFIFTNTYGIAPTNTTLTIRYIVGGGVDSNIDANSLTQITPLSNIQFQNNSLDATTAQYIFDSVEIQNPEAATGGQDGDSIEELRQNTISNIATQLRAVTPDDYLVRTLSLPSKFGAIAKAHVQKPISEDTSNTTLDIYTLSYDLNKHLRKPSNALKENLKTYLNEYKMIGDSLTIKDGFIINIGVDFEIITLPNFNNNEVLRKCLVALINYFNIDNWQINEPIILRNINVLLDEIDGVQTVKKLTINNKTGTTLGYSQYAYDIDGATQNNVVYPSIDPMIFEVKYPNQDITGRVVKF